jgi:hypothetical protein
METAGQYFLGSAPIIEGRLKLNPYGIPVCYSFSHQNFLAAEVFSHATNGSLWAYSGA